jgi:hypothetical protein
MVNEARTFLLNTSGAIRPTIGTDGEEYILPSYRPVADDSVMKTVRSLLLGPNPSNIVQNYRAAQYMSILHANSIGCYYVLNLDTRYTYDLRAFNSFDFSTLPTTLASEPTLGSIALSLESKQGIVPSLCKGGTEEPYKTFQNMFFQGYRLTDKLTGVLLALIYRTKELYYTNG